MGCNVTHTILYFYNLASPGQRAPPVPLLPS